MVYTEKCKNNMMLGEMLPAFPSVQVSGRADE